MITMQDTFQRRTYIFLLWNGLGVHVMGSVVKELLIPCHHLTNMDNWVEEEIVQEHSLLFIVNVDIEVSMDVLSLT